MRTALSLVVLSSLLFGCDREGGDEKKLLENMERLSRAPVATDEFLNSNSLIECHAKSVQVCSPDGCKAGQKIVITQTYDPKNQIYQRSDNGGGDKYSATASSSGIWYNVGIPESGLLFRFNTLGDFLEVATLNDSAIVYSGSCQFR